MEQAFDAVVNEMVEEGHLQWNEDSIRCWELMELYLAELVSPEFKTKTTL